MGLLDPGPETLILVLIIVALLFGTNRLPQLMRALGRAQVEYRRGREQIQRQLEEAVAEAEQLDGNRKVRDRAGPAKVATSKGAAAAAAATAASREDLERAARRREIVVDGKSDDEIRAALIEDVVGKERDAAPPAPDEPRSAA